MRNAIPAIVMAIIIAMYSFGLITSKYAAKHQCQETVDWAIQTTSDELLQYCEEKMEEKNCK